MTHAAMSRAERTSPALFRLRVDELETLTQRDCLRQSLPEALGKGYSNLYQLDRDVSYIETAYTPYRDLAIASRMDTHEPRLVITLGTQGKSCFVDELGQQVVFAEGYTTVTAFTTSVGERLYRAGEAVTQLRVAVTRSWLEAYLDADIVSGLFRRDGVHTLSHRPTSVQGTLAAQQLLRGQVPERFRAMARQGAILSIVAAEMGPLYTTKLSDASPCNARDEAMANQARDILAREFQSPPSVAELSKRVGTNEFKLKQLFHRYFGDTPYGVLYEIRMMRAYQLLHCQRCSVNLAAEAVGYRHASNFTTAFVRYFGVAPKSLANK